jgi:SAM-dependent methyltransferase
MNLSQLFPEPVRIVKRKVFRFFYDGFYFFRSGSYPYKCPICRKRIKEFRPIDKYYAENQQKYGHVVNIENDETLNSQKYHCPECGTTDRERLYGIYIERTLSSLPKGKRIKFLEFAPRRALRQFLSSQKKLIYRCADISKIDVDDHIDIMNMYIYEDNSFDAFICSHVLEHVTDDRKALSELWRILKPGGWGIIMVPINLTLNQIDEDPSIIDEAERWRRFGQFDHVRLYSKHGFLQRVKEANFTIQQLGIDFFGKESFDYYGISPKSILYVGMKTIQDKQEIQSTLD